MKKTAIYLAISFLLATILVIYTPKEALSQTAKAIKWRIQSTYSPTSHVTRQLTWWADEVNKRSGGRISFEILPMNMLFKSAEAFESVADGVAEGSLCSLHYDAGKLPEGDVGWTPCIWTAKEYIRIWTKTEYLNILNEAMAKFNLHQISVIGSGAFPLISNFPVNKLDDFTAKRIRALGVEADFIKTFGAAPVNIIPAEIYTALQRGTMDGIFWPVYTLKDYKFWEVCKYVAMLNIHDNVEVDLYFNLKSFNTLPKDVQKTMKEVGKELVGRAAKIGEEMNHAIVEEAKAKGVNIIYPTKGMERIFTDGAKPFWEQAASKSPNCRKLMDTILKVKAEKK